MSYSGIFGAPVENFKNLLANVSAFQTFAGVDNLTDAKARINEVLKSATSKTWPLAIVRFGTWSADRDTAGAGYQSFGVDSHLLMILEKKVDEITPAEVESLVNSAGSIVDGIMTLTGTSDYMYISKIDGHEEIFFQDEEEEEKMLRAIFEISWGM